MTDRKQLPIGIQTFADIRNRNCYYVDKTPLILELAREKVVFLSRPRRFGKSLTLDTLAELFSANKPLFTGLYAEQHWNWKVSYPIIRIGFTKGVIRTQDHLDSDIKKQLINNGKRFGIQLEDDYVPDMFQSLIHAIAEQTPTHKVVVLVDEYDKPMLDNLGADLLLVMRDVLRGFYSVIKDCDAYIQFAMLTGVSKFSKVNLFSGLNNPNDITLNKKYSALCGYTQDELESVFADCLQDVDLDLVKFWYNGYNWLGESVYNPFDILLFLENAKQFKPYWAETGNPTFLIDTLMSRKVKLFDILEETADNSLLAKFDVNDVEPIALMFQTGYLTIDKVTSNPIRGTQFTLKYPNHEIRQSINNNLLNKYISRRFNVFKRQDDLYEYLLNQQFDKLQPLLTSLYASIPYDWYRNNNIAHYEGYWASVFYSFFASTGFDIRCEDSSNLGQVDMTVQYLEDVFIFEFKVVEKIDRNTGKIVQSLPLGSAIQQIKDKQYAQKYATNGKSVYLFGVEFSEDSRNVVNLEWEAFITNPHPKIT